MGEVWRARDTKLGREVAIKTLPAEFAQDADRLARFEREARLLASLNHPNIAAIYGLEEHEGTRFLILELVEGETLADRIRNGAIPLEEALDLARQVAEALEAAHAKGVVHRDLKPANIKVTPDGKVKVLDFGLAKAFGADTSEPDASNSPTLSMSATGQGVILGTAAYMSPEQARSKEVDARTDIFAFGCVLFEMLSGHQAFGAETATDSIARVVAGQPDWSLLPDDTPPPVRAVLNAALTKDVNQRLQHSLDLRLFLDPAVSLTAAVAASDVPVLTQRRWPGFVLYALAGVGAVVVALVVAEFAITVLRSETTAGLQWFDRNGRRLGDVYEIPGATEYRDLTLSPDGTEAAVSASVDSNPNIYVVDLESGRPRLITRHIANDWSPVFFDGGARIAFVSDRGGSGELWATAATGTETPERVVDYPIGAPTGTSRDGQSVAFSVSAPPGLALMLWSPLSDEPPVEITRSESTIVMARLSADGRFVAYRSNETGIPEILVQPVEDASSDKVPISTGGGTEPKWCGECGELYYLTLDGWLMAVPYDDDGAFVAGNAERLFLTEFQPGAAPTFFKTFDVRSDGGQFLMVVGPKEPVGPLTSMANWISGRD